MNLRDLIGADRVVTDLRLDGKEQLLGELARQATARIPVEAQAVLAALSARERLGSTGLGRGFALPHARVHGVEQLFGLFVRLAQPIEYDAIDGQPVDLVFLLLIPPDSAGHVAALAAIARAMRDAGTLENIRRASGATDLCRILLGANHPADR